MPQRLRKDGLRLWPGMFDAEWMLKPGDHVQAKIEEGLEQSRVLVLRQSANAFGSDWMRLESYTFRFRNPLNRERRFIPLRLDAAEIKGSLTNYSAVVAGARTSCPGFSPPPAPVTRT
ncbi:MAG: toll/interleukin-1 receptor domain-containing protein [Acidobacteriota bacterium]